MELEIKIDGHTVTIGYGENIKTAWENAIEGFTNWVEHYNNWTPAERASALLPTDWKW